MTSQTDDKPFYLADAREKDRAYRHFAPFIKYFKNCRSGLEIASGQGFFLNQVKEAGGTVEGVEIAPELCEQIRQRGLTVHQQDFFEFLEGSPDNHFDGCMAAHIVEHFMPPDVARLLTLLHRTMKPRAQLVIITPNIANLRKAAGDFWRDPTHIRPYPVQSLEKLFKMTGWKVIESGYHYSDRKPSGLRKIKYAARNALFGRFWVGEAVYAIAEKE